MSSPSPAAPRFASPLGPLRSLVSRYPLLVLLAASPLAILWGLILTDVEAFHLFWNEDPWTGLAAGALVALALAEVVLWTRRLDLDRDAPAWSDPARDAPDGADLSAHLTLCLLAVLPAVVRGDLFHAKGVEGGDPKWTLWPRVSFPAGVAPGGGRVRPGGDPLLQSGAPFGRRADDELVLERHGASPSGGKETQWKNHQLRCGGTRVQHQPADLGLSRRPASR